MGGQIIRNVGITSSHNLGREHMPRSGISRSRLFVGVLGRGTGDDDVAGGAYTPSPTPSPTRTRTRTRTRTPALTHDTHDRREAGQETYGG